MGVTSPENNATLLQGFGSEKGYEVTIGDAIETYKLGLDAELKAEATVKRYMRALTRFQAFAAGLGVFEMKDLHVEQARSFQIARRQQGLSNATLHYETAPLKAWTRWLEENEYIDRDPFKRLRKPKLAHVEKQIINHQGVKRLLATFDQKDADQFRDLVIVKLIISTGIRRSEALGIMLSDVDLPERKVRIHGKGRKDRWVTLSDEMALMLNKYIKSLRGRHKPKEENVFITRRGKHLDPSAFGKRFADNVRLANLPVHVTLHHLRHYYATATLGQGASIEIVSRSMGHADSRITSQIYSHVTYADVAAMHAQYDPLKLVASA